MTVPANDGHIEHLGNNTAGPFTYDFKIDTASELEVRVDNTIKTADVHFSISNIGVAAGGNVTFLSPHFPATNAVISFRRKPLYEQLLDLQDNSALSAESLEGRLDAIVKMVQSLQEELSRRPAVVVGSANSLRDLALPVGNSKLIGWNSTSTGLTLVDPTSTSPITDPALIDDFSGSLGQFQTETDPGELGTESLPTSLAGEIARLRFGILDTKQAIDPGITEWYETPTRRNEVVVPTYATGGLGTSGSPWTGWDTAITWAARTTYIFPAGWYSYATAPNWAFDEIHLIGLGEVVLNHTGNGNAVLLDAGIAPSNAIVFGPIMKDFIVKGNANSTNGILLRGVSHGIFENLSVVGCSTTGAGLRLEHCVLNEFRTYKCSENDADNLSGSGFYVEPDYGIRLEQRQAGEKTTANVFTNIIIEGLVNNSNGVGVYINNGDCNTFIGGTSEHNLQGLWTTANSLYVTVMNMFFEGNTNQNVQLYGEMGVLINCVSSDSIGSEGLIVRSTGVRNTIIGGQFTHAVTLEASATGNHFLNVRIDGAFTDNGTRTTVAHCTIAGDYQNRASHLDGVGVTPLILGQDGEGIGIGQTGHTLKKYYTFTAAYAGGTINAGDGTTIASFTASGVLLGDPCTVSLSVDSQLLHLYAWVDADGHIKVQAYNGTGGNITIGASTLRVSAFRH